MIMSESISKEFLKELMEVSLNEAIDIASKAATKLKVLNEYLTRMLGSTEALFVIDTRIKAFEFLYKNLVALSITTQIGAEEEYIKTKKVIEELIDVMFHLTKALASVREQHINRKK